ncbi:MAG TPA: peptide-methionine (S)-S-oxide reductase MsrA [Burkholderiales bacterium]|nr:peptide-methionine (S)-S-oxide reductase MsrA [Burkholderiales bacterium]
MSGIARNGWWVAPLALAALGLLWNTPGRSGEAAAVVAAPALDNPKAAGPTQTAVLAGGCFWGVQGVYQYTRGVKKVLSGYSGGDRSTAEYEKVGTGRTGHAESVEIVFDPKEVSYGEILRIYFSVAHDPTQLDRQGPDVGTQYRSAIFYADAQQKRIAEAYIAQLDKARVFRKPIATRVDALKGFYPAEAYHQDFMILNPRYPYIVINDLPKVANLKRLFPEQYRDKPVMTTASAS